MANLATTTTTPQQQLETLRSRAFGDVSGAGIGGIQGASSPRIDNPLPIQPDGLAPSQAPQTETPTDGAQARLGQDRGEAKSIVSTLSTRLKVLSERGE